MKNKNLIISLLALLAGMNVSAAERSAAEMQQLALQALKTQNGASSGNRAMQIIDVSLVKSDNTYNVYSNGNSSFVIVSRDDRFTPVLACAKGNFLSTNHSPAFNWWLSATAAGMQEMIDNGEVPAPKRASALSVVEPLMTTEWGQETMPYYAYTPEIGNTKCAAGCGAVTLSELLNYHKYPSSVDFTGTYSVDNGKTYRSERIISTYTWNFKDRYGQYSTDGSDKLDGYAAYSPSQGRAVATLMRDCGYAVNMVYNYSSSAHTQDVPLALVNCFQFPDESVKLFYEDFFVKEDWDAMIHGELEKGYPVLLFGNDAATGYGHIFVAHGWDAEGKVAIEWGWIGVDNGYYSMDYLRGSKYNFSYNLGVVTAHPYALSTDRFESLWITDKPYSIKYNPTANSLSISIPGGLYNFEKGKFTGELGLVLEKEATGEVGFINLTGGQILEFDFGTGLSATSTTLSNCSFDPNTVYYVYLASKDNRDVEWQPVRTIGGAQYFTLRVDGTGNAVFDDDYKFATGIESVKADNAHMGSTKIYSLDGTQVKGNAKGIKIVKNERATRKVYF